MGNSGTLERASSLKRKLLDISAESEDPGASSGAIDQTNLV
jgi:hypothetical protein